MREVSASIGIVSRDCSVVGRPEAHLDTRHASLKIRESPPEDDQICGSHLAAPKAELLLLVESREDFALQLLTGKDLDRSTASIASCVPGGGPETEGIDGVAQSVPRGASCTTGSSCILHRRDDSTKLCPALSMCFAFNVGGVRTEYNVATARLDCGASRNSWKLPALSGKLPKEIGPVSSSCPSLPRRYSGVTAFLSTS